MGIPMAKQIRAEKQRQNDEDVHTTGRKLVALDSTLGKTAYGVDFERGYLLGLQTAEVMLEQATAGTE
jgi:hypothetical protein